MRVQKSVSERMERAQQLQGYFKREGEPEHTSPSIFVDKAVHAGQSEGASKRQIERDVRRVKAANRLRSVGMPATLRPEVAALLGPLVDECTQRVGESKTVVMQNSPRE